MAFRVGQRVVCVRDAARPDFIWTGRVRPVRGRVYTVRGFVDNTHCGDGIGILLDEIVHPVNHLHGSEPNFDPDRFRPVVSRKTSIEIFERLLKPSPARVKDFCGND